MHNKLWHQEKYAHTNIKMATIIYWEVYAVYYFAF